MLLRKAFRSFPSLVNRYTHSHSHNLPKPSTKPQFQVIDTNQLPNDDYIDVPFERKSVLEKCKEDISHVAPYLRPTFNFAAYVNKSKTLQELVNLGVDLYKLEKWDKPPYFLLKLDFEKDMKKYVIFLSDIGVPVDELGLFITRNPHIFEEDLDNLAVRINYLKSKRFSNEMIARIVTRNPYWLSFSTQQIDERLGFFQKNFSLTGDQIRTLSTQQPKLITYDLDHVKLNTFSIKEEMGFTDEEIKAMLLRKPNIFMKTHENLLRIFEFIQRKMNLPPERITQFPEVLLCRESRIKQRHLFLKEQGRAQYNPLEPNYVSLLALISGSDARFCSEVAKSSIQAFNAFLKTL